MNVTEGLIIGLSSSFKNKMRSLLTMLGIIIGISGVVGVVSMGSGAEKLILSEFERIGATNEVRIGRRECIRKDGHRDLATQSSHLQIHYIYRLTLSKRRQMILSKLFHRRPTCRWLANGGVAKKSLVKAIRMVN